MKKVVGITMLLIIAAVVVYILVDLVSTLGPVLALTTLAIAIFSGLWIIIAIHLVSGGSNAKDTEVRNKEVPSR
jgi:hypothetical protein